MTNVNVNRNVSDQFYRYKMPKIIAKVEGKGNGIKTVIVNMVEVAKALDRPATYTTKYFGCELGAQTQFDFKNDRYIVNGSHDSLKLQDLLDGFIKRFVLCPGCDNPETNLLVSQKKGTINQSCMACGYNGMVDMRHKLTTFILKNPPENKPAMVGSSLTTPKEKGKGKRKSEVNLPGTSSAGKAGRISAGSGKSAEKQNGENGGGSDDDDRDELDGVVEKDEDDDWGEDTSEHAVAQRMKMLTDGAKGLTLNDDLEKTPQERLDLFYSYVKGKKTANRVNESDREFVAEADRLDIREKAPLVLAEVLLDVNILQQVKTHRVVFLRFTHENVKAQRYLLGGIEQVINLHKDILLPKVAHILKALYDMDILDEEEILEWAKKPSKKYVSKEMAQEIHDRAAPFVKWLQEAEESANETDSDEEDDVEVVYDDRTLSHGLKEQQPAVVKPNHVKNGGKTTDIAGGEEDLDIDAI